MESSSFFWFEFYDGTILKLKSFVEIGFYQVLYWPNHYFSSCSARRKESVSVF